MKWPQCSNVAYIISYEREYLVTTVVENEDGSKSIVSIQLIGSVPQWDSQTVCQISQFSNLN